MVRNHIFGCSCLRRNMAAASPGILGRRDVLAGFAATVVASAVKPVPARAAETRPQRIDVHHNLSPPTYVAAANANHVGEAPMRNWTVDKSLDDMDRAGVATAMLSITTPGVNFIAGEPARGLSRECNEYAAKLIADHPGRFGSFAMVPLTDTDGALREIEYALGTLKADGIGLLTSYGDKWLGHPSFLPVMDELKRRKALVYTHPTTANCCVNLVKTQQPAMIEFGTDTTRTIADIIFSGNAVKFRDISWIFSHAGGTMPMLLDRFVRNAFLDPNAKQAVPDGTLAELRRFYYDTAQTANKPAMLALSSIVPVSQIVFGTDFPYRTSIDHVTALRDCGVFSEAQLADIERGNALKLLPRLAA